MAELFKASAQDTPWEWAKNRRQFFRSPVRDTFVFVLSALVTACISFAVGAPNVQRTALVSLGTALLVRAGLPWLEAAWWWSQRTMILLEEDNERLRRLYEEKIASTPVQTHPELALIFDPSIPQCIHDKAGVDNQTLRIFRVGIQHSGTAPVTVRVRLIDMSPYQQGATYRSHELLPSGQDFDTFTATVNPTATPLVYFEVAGQLFPDNGPARRLHIRYAAKGLKYRYLTGDGPYRLVIGIDAPRAEAPLGLTLKKNPAGIWEMVKAAEENLGQLTVNIQRSRF